MDDLTADRTPETHLNTLRTRGYLGTPLVGDKPAVYRFPKEPLPVNKLPLAGTWTTEYEHFTAGPDARLAFIYRARNANLVLAGTGKVTVIVDGKVTKTINVSGSPALHRSPTTTKHAPARLELRLDEGLEAYASTPG